MQKDSLSGLSSVSFVSSPKQPQLKRVLTNSFDFWGEARTYLRPEGSSVGTAEGKISKIAIEHFWVLLGSPNFVLFEPCWTSYPSSYLSSGYSSAGLELISARGWARELQTSWCLGRCKRCSSVCWSTCACDAAFGCWRDRGVSKIYLSDLSTSEASSILCLLTSEGSFRARLSGSAPPRSWNSWTDPRELCRTAATT